MTGLSRSMFVWVGVPWVVAVMVGTAASQEAGARPVVTQAEFGRWLTELSNWDRWGPDDEVGALNLITSPIETTSESRCLTPTGNS